MQISIHDSSMERIGFMNNNLPDALHYFDDTWHRYLKEGTSTFDFTVSKAHPDSALITTQSYISFNYESQDYLFNVMTLKEDDYWLQVKCENLNLELINEQLNPKTNKEKHTLDWYIWNAAGLSSNVVAIGNNPFTDTKILTFENTETKLARLISIISSWNGEFEFVTTLKNNGTLNQVLLNIYPEGGVGEVREDVTLYYGRNIEGVTRTEDKSEMFNATRVTDSNNKFKWSNLEKTVKNSDGNIEFYKKLNEDMAYAPIGKDIFPSQIKNDKADQWIRKDFQIEAKSAEDLWDYALSQLKQYAYPLVTYEVVASSNAVRAEHGNNKRLNIGDTVIVQDTNFDKTEGGLILSTRISEQEISFSNPANDKMTYSNFIKLKSLISDNLIDRMNEIANDKTPYRLEISTDNGTVFKNSAGHTTLASHVYFGADIEETTPDSIQWFKDNTEIPLGDTSKWTVNAEDIDEKAVYYYQATVGEKTYKSMELTITDVSDGLNGVDGRSIVSVEQKYQITNSETAPTEPWEDSAWIPDTPFPDKEHPYLWQMTRTTYNKEPLTSDVKVLAGTYGKGEDGKNSINLLPNSTWNLGKGHWTFDVGSGKNFEIQEPYTDKPNSYIVHALPSASGSQQLSNIPHPVWVNAGEVITLAWDYRENQIPNKDSSLFALRVFPEIDTPNSQANSLWFDNIPHSKVNPDWATNPIIEWNRFMYSVTVPVSGWFDTIVYDSDTSGTHESWFRELMLIKGDSSQMPDIWLPYIGDLEGKPGADAWAVNMTSSSVTLPADNEGKVLSYANSGNSFTVISGSGGYLTPRASSASLGPNEFQVTATATNCKVGVSTILTDTHQVAFANISEIPDGVGRTAFIEFAIKVNIAGQIAHVYKTQNFATATGGKPGPPGDAGEPVTVTGQKIDYASWPSATEFPDDGAEWVSDIPIVPEGEYLWTRMIIQFSDGSESRPFYSIGNQIDLNAVYSKIEQTKDGILQTVGENYTSNDEFHQLQTTFEQTADSFQMGFDNVSKFMDVGGDLTEDEFEVESSFIKFDATGITLGQSSSPIQLILSPTQLVFDQAGYPVAVMSNNKLTINNAEIGEFLKLGNFEFIPQTNGNLSFMKVG